MKGRSPFNNPPVRKTDVYRLLLKLGGEARWKHLKAHVKELKWSPTTLKQTLDEMIKDGSIRKEARLSPEGAEVWYIAAIKDSDIWELFRKIIEKGREPPFERLTKGIKDKLQQLKTEAEKEVFLKQQLRKILEMARDTYAGIFYIGIRQHNPKTFELIFDTAFKTQTMEWFQFFLEHRTHSMRVIIDSLKESAGEGGAST
ncbi:MAG: hypothetical protein QMD23_04040 [Candidatus Bathyarchaeia archaeon]|nr:hypothetical protein [Candidatus Bathyarchaeia archaeon]